jgi:predicted alpha/beta hydrolase family esterase
MTKQVLFIQGGGAGTYDEWDNKLVDSLQRELGPGYSVSYPRMPDEGDPGYAAWKAALLEEIGRLDDGAVLVGHSIGGTFLINTLAEAPPKRQLAGVFLIAPPFAGPGGWSMDGIAATMDLGAGRPAGMPIHLYHGSQDDTVPWAHANLYAQALPGAVVHRLDGRDHQLNDDLAELAADVRALMQGMQ